MVDFMENPMNIWITRGTPFLGNPHLMDGLMLVMINAPLGFVFLVVHEPTTHQQSIGGGMSMHERHAGG